MAYCVHCGVKLDDAEPRCPLCGTVPVDPSAPERPHAPRAYPVRTPEQTLTMNRRYSVSLLSVLLLGPAVVCLLLDLLSGGMTWSIYPSGILALSWVTVATPLLIKKHRLYTTLLITTCAIAGYLFMVERLVTPQASWFLHIALPLLALLAGGLCFAIALRRKWKVRKLLIAAIALVEMGLLSFAVELLLAGQDISTALSWSPYVMAPCFFGAVLLMAISRNRPLYDELTRRLHF